MVLIGMLGVERGLDPQAVTALPRYHHQYLPDEISIEPGALPDATVAALRAMGHTVVVADKPWGNLQAVDWDRRTGALRAGSDPRNPAGSGRVETRAAAAEAVPAR
jgi:gamma-glutamyltranspeptidase/glutathione hydrolase